MEPARAWHALHFDIASRCQKPPKLKTSWDNGIHQLCRLGQVPVNGTGVNGAHEKDGPLKTRLVNLPF